MVDNPLDLLKSHNIVAQYVPIFSGIEGQKVENFFKSVENATSVTRKVNETSAALEQRRRVIALLRLDGEALSFLHNLPESVKNDYKGLKSAILKRFTDLTTCADYSMQLANLEQRRLSVRQLIAEIRRLAVGSLEDTLPNLIAQQREPFLDTLCLQTLLRSLNRDLLEKVSLKAPKNWEEAQEIALRAEKLQSMFQNHQSKVGVLYRMGDSTEKACKPPIPAMDHSNRDQTGRGTRRKAFRNQTQWKGKIRKEPRTGRYRRQGQKSVNKLSKTRRVPRPPTIRSRAYRKSYLCSHKQ